MTDSPPPGWLDVLHSVAAAFFGVQSAANRERDFTRGRFSHYLIAGLTATFLFVLGLLGLVKLILMLAGTP